MDKVVLILAGGSGKRLWPISRENCPKQFLPSLTDGPSLFAQTFIRAEQLAGTDNVFVIAPEKYHARIISEAPSIHKDRLITEPARRGTAAAVLFALSVIRRQKGDCVVAVLPSDHFIGDGDAFLRYANNAFACARDTGRLVLFGISPDRPETGYGYIAPGELIRHEPTAVYQARRFTEKPSLPNAENCIAEGYYWNSGIYFGELSVFLEEAKRYIPQTCEVCLNLQNKVQYEWLPNMSIDKGVAEKSEAIAVIPADFQWDDLGSLHAIARHFPADPHGNIVVGAADLTDTDDCTVCSDGRLTALIGVKDLIVLQADGVTVICSRDRIDDIKELTSNLADNNREDLL